MRTILFVHDELETSWPRRHFLESAGYRVESVARSEDCLAALARATPDLIVIDVLIEGLNGFELCRRIRSKLKARDVPIVLGSNIYVADVFRAEAARVGAQAYMIEPGDCDALLSAVNLLLVARDADEAQAAA